MAEISAIVPVRGNSKGIHRKNMVPVGGRPLMYWVTSAALATSELSRVVVSTDDDEMAGFAAQLGAVVHRRSSQAASDTASTEEAIAEVLEWAPEIDVVVLLQATSPMTTSDDIYRAVQMWREDPTGSIVSATRSHSFRWTASGDPLNYEPRERPRRQNWAGEFVENGAIYVSERRAYMDALNRCLPPVRILEMAPESAIEIDSELDLLLADAVLLSKSREVDSEERR